MDRHVLRAGCGGCPAQYGPLSCFSTALLQGRSRGYPSPRTVSGHARSGPSRDSLSPTAHSPYNVGEAEQLGSRFLSRDVVVSSHRDRPLHTRSRSVSSRLGPYRDGMGREHRDLSRPVEEAVPAAELERTFRFRSRHQYRRADLSEALNHEHFGTASYPHEHEYSLTITVGGELDRHGFVADLARLDQAVQEVIAPLDGGDLNRLVFTDGAVQPSTEALARWFWGRLADRVPEPARLIRVRVAEGPDLAAMWSG